MQAYRLQAPVEYTIMKYKEKFGLSHEQFKRVPWHVFMRETEMLSIENTVINSARKAEEQQLRRNR